MILTEDFKRSESGSGERRLTFFYPAYAGHTQSGWSTSNVTFQDRRPAASTVLEEPGIEQTCNFLVWFEQGTKSDPLGLSRIVYVDEGSDQIPTQISTGALTKISVRSSEPIMSVLQSFGGCIIFKPTPLQVAVFRRINELRELALEDEIEMSPSSFSDLWSFISARPLASIPNVFGLDNGNFRAVWRNSQGERVALEFCGDQTVAFVIFEYDHAIAKMMRIAGIQRVNRIQDQITAVCAGHLLMR